MFAERENVVQTEERGVQVESEKEEEKFELTERIMLDLINDDSFMKEVSPIPRPSSRLACWEGDE